MKDERPLATSAKSIIGRLQLMRVLTYRPGPLAVNTMLGTFWQGLRLACQMLFIIFLAKAMGASGYGTFSGFGGLAVILGGLSGLGSGYYMLQNVSASKASFGALWTTCIFTTTGSGMALTAIYAVVAPIILSAPLAPAALLGLAISELVCFPLIYASTFAFQAHERLGWATALPAQAALMRLIGAWIFLVASTRRDFETYVLFHTASTIAASMAAVLAVQIVLRPRIAPSIDWHSIPRGIGYSLGWLTSNAYGETDKVLTARFLDMTTAGIYALAYRLVSAFGAPVAALALAVQPRIYRVHAGANREGGARLLQLSLCIVACYSVIAGLALVVIAPGLLPLLGDEFSESAIAVKLLTPILLLISARLILGTYLSSTARVHKRANIELASTMLLLVAGALLIPLYGIRGAIASIYLAETLQLGCIIAICHRSLWRR